MTEIQQWQPEQQAIDVTDRAVQRLGEWATSAQAAHQVAQSLVQTSFVPDGFRGKPHEATAAILAGLEVGLSPMAALRSFDVIQGQAAPRAVTLRAILQSHGHQIVVDESTATRCKVRGKRRGSGEWQTVVWTIDRAKQLGLTGKANWKNQPQAMLVARATSELARLIAADAILGIAYTAEEIADGASPGGAPVEVAPPSSSGRRMSRQQKVVEPGAGPVEDAEVVEPISDAQMRKLHATFNERGIVERDDRLAFAASVVERPVESSKDLSRDEAGRVIDALESLPASEPEGWEPTDA